MDRSAAIAEEVIHNRGFEIPDPRDRRGVMRLLARYRPRIRPGHIQLRFVIEYSALRLICAYRRPHFAYM